MKKQFLSIAVLFFLVQNLSIAQLVWTDPVFPRVDDEVTIFFDATQGTGGLANCNCNVYLHTGVITSESNSPSDWKHVVTTWGQANPAWQMTPVAGQSNVYEYTISPTVFDYYNINMGEIVEDLAMVFRNGNGSLEGKADGGADIFYPIYPDDFEFTSILVSPSSSSIFTSIGEMIEVKGIASENSTLSLYDNANLIYETMGSNLEYTIDITESGTHQVDFVANNGVDEITHSFQYTIPNDTEIEDLPAGIDHGINYTSDGSVLFALVAPGKEHVFLIGDFNDWNIDTDYQLKRTSDGNIWWIEIDGLTPDQQYAFQYLVDGEIRTGDPYAELILDPSNDGWIPEITYPNIPEYPTGKTNGVVSVIHPGAPDFDWQVNDFERPAKENLVIYELLMRDFLARHDFETLLDTLDYLDRLGITAIELMPVNEFSGNNSWGYNPTYHTALDKYYGTKDDFKTFIDACHERGIAVILDVVFNHTHELNPLAMLYWNQSSFKPAADNPWLNQDPTHDFNVFFDFNHESVWTKAFVEKVLKYWLNEYRVDGFRFDLSKGLTQNTNGPWHAGNYDATRIATLKQYADVIWDTSPGAYTILEHFTAVSEEEELSNYKEGMMVWSGFGPHNQFLEASMGYGSNLSSAHHLTRGLSKPHLISYIESHDEERMMYKNKEFGNSFGNYDITDIETGLKRSELAHVFFFSIPGPKLMWQFGELGYDFSINHCPNGNIDPNCRVDPKPIRWDYQNDENRNNLYDVIRGMTFLKNNYEVFTTESVVLDVAGSIRKKIMLLSNDHKILVLGNFDVKEADIAPGFPGTGTWYEYFTGDVLEVTNSNDPLHFEPGEYRVYSDVQLPTPPGGIISSDLQGIEKSATNFNILPNPTEDQITIQYELTERKEIDLAVYHVSGELVEFVIDENQVAGQYSFNVGEDLEAGTYLIRLVVDGEISTKKFVKIR